MEQNIFPTPAVAEVLKKSYVEARLHMDLPAVRAKYTGLQDELVGTIATPSYVLVDPKTGKVLARQDGWLPSETGFAKFLAGPLAAAARGRQ